MASERERYQLTDPWPTTMSKIYLGMTRKCPTCNGSGVNPVLPTMVCPKCKGEKVVYV